jgi:hypothetical protein
MTEDLIEPTDVSAEELEAELAAGADGALVPAAEADDTTDDTTADAEATAVAATGKVDEIMARIRGQRLVDGGWLVDQLLDVSNLAPLSPIAGHAFAVVGELRGRSLVDRTWAVDQLLDLRAAITDRRN